ncbi:MAG: PRC-barrel domain-containing protein [Thermomicrobiales bacterium]
MAIPLTKGTPVVSLADGTRLGTIDHVYFDPESKSVVGFTFHQGGILFGRGSSGLVDITDVHAFGADAVTITDVSAVRSELAVENRRDTLLDLETLLHRTVMTEGGIRVGRVRSIHFGDASYHLSGLEVDGADGEGPLHIASDRIQTVGDELIIIADAQPNTAENHPERRKSLRVVSVERGHGAVDAAVADPAAPQRVMRSA